METLGNSNRIFLTIIAIRTATFLELKTYLAACRNSCKAAAFDRSFSVTLFIFRDESMTDICSNRLACTSVEAGMPTLTLIPFTSISWNLCPKLSVEWHWIFQSYILPWISVSSFTYSWKCILIVYIFSISRSIQHLANDKLCNATLSVDMIRSAMFYHDW